jgi:hypothetical protein
MYLCDIVVYAYVTYMCMNISALSNRLIHPRFVAPHVPHAADRAIPRPMYREDHQGFYFPARTDEKSVFVDRHSGCTVLSMQHPVV